MECGSYEIEFPDKGSRLDQDMEWIKISSEDHSEKIRLHNYGKIYSVPGLYEEVVYTRLKCTSPRVICSMLKEEMEKAGEVNGDLRVLDFGAGNGMAGERLAEEIGCDALVGVDIVPEAKMATLRDRPDLYDDYHVMDFCEVDEAEEASLMKWDFNALITVAALGYGDIPPRAFINAFNLLQKDAWVVFNIKDRFLTEEDDTGFRETFEDLFDDNLRVLQTKHYRHRYSMSGEPLHYVAVAGRKIKDTEASGTLPA